MSFTIDFRMFFSSEVHSVKRQVTRQGVVWHPQTTVFFICLGEPASCLHWEASGLGLRPSQETVHN